MNTEYNYNPFLSRGRLSGLMYFIYTIIFSILCTFLGLDFFIANKYMIIRLLSFIITFLLIFPQVFILKKRLYDICLNNKLAWILTAILFVFFIISFVIGYATTALFAFLLLLFIPKYETISKLWK